jgi:hypothetical protein
MLHDLDKALDDIQSIRRQVARSTDFRGYGPATLACTAAMAVVAAVLQKRLVPDPARHLAQYLILWLATAALASSAAGIQMYTRSRRLHSRMSDEMIQMAVEQFLPSIITSMLLTFVLLRYVPENVWMLPGIWQIIFSLGIFASCRFLPRLMLGAGAWYLLTGLACIALGDNRALSPWAMGIPYAIGQSLVASVLYFAAQEVSDES